jgi:acetoin utilization deacetylase AcuC-like enzyme
VCEPDSQLQLKSQRECGDLKVHDEEYLDFMRHKAQNSVFRTGGMSSLSDSESDAPVNETAISTHSVDAIMSVRGWSGARIHRAHDPQLLKLLTRTDMWVPHDVQAAGCVLRAIDATHERRAKNAFCLVRVSLWGSLPCST